MKTFDEIGLDDEIKRAIVDLGFEKPTPIQSQVIPHLLSSGRDLIALAQTGTGKTAAYGLPLIQQIDISSKYTQVLVLCPTRELCIQITKDIDTYSKYLKGLRTTAVYGGAKIETQITSLKRGTQIVVGTPGRTLDLIKRKKLVVSNIQWLVLDEADEMLTMGFKDELDGILDGTPKEKQTMLFSATMPKEIRSITKKYMRDPHEITAGKMNIGAENVKHDYYMVHAGDRYEALKRIADINPDIYGIVFCRTRRETKEIADKLISDGYNADALHGDLSQAQRDIVMNRFREKHLQLLIATDVAARGLDVNDLSHIINFGLPEEQDIYLHRSGRTGRAGKSGVSISIVHSRAGNKIKNLEKKLGKPFEKKKVPDGREVCEMRLFNMIDKLENVEVDEVQILPFLPDIYEKIISLSREDIVKKFVWLEFNRFLSYYKGATDLNVRPQHEKSEKGRKINKGRRDVEFARFYINLGLVHRISPQRLMGIINEKLRIRNIIIGKIDIMKRFSFFEIDMEYRNEVINAFEGANYEGNNLLVEPVKNKGGQAERKPYREKRKRRKRRD
ncbi:DEAD/DEAH box helicase [Bacteroidota bacterium]